MVPYFEQPTLPLGPIILHGFGALVAIAILAGSDLTLRRCRKAGLDADVCGDMLFYVVLCGFLVAHLYAVLAYFPGEAFRNPVLFLKVWENISSFGGIAGGLLGMGFYLRWKGREIPGAVRWHYLDTVAYAFPFAWAIGRLGCTVAHDHPGTITRFPLGVSLSTPQAQGYIVSVYEAAGKLAALPPRAELSGMAFHDLGFYEFLYTLLVIVPAFLLLDRKPRPAAFFPVAFLLLYSPVRFFLDFLRMSDARYFGLTPAQYAAVVAFAAAVYLFRRGRPAG